MESLGDPDQRKETVGGIRGRAKGRGRGIGTRNYLTAVDERFQVSRREDPGWLEGNNQ